MTTAELLVMLEANLEIITDYMDSDAKTAKETELTQYITAAEAYIAREGITLDLTQIGDCMLVVMYAGWLYDKRKADSAGMPRMLRWNLNNRLFSQKVGEVNASG